jgi:hypothetical protein
MNLPTSALETVPSAAIILQRRVVAAALKILVDWNLNGSNCAQGTVGLGRWFVEIFRPDNWLVTGEIGWL